MNLSLDSLPPGNDKLTLKKDLHKENIQDLSKPLLDEMEENVEIKKSNVSDELVLLNTPLSDKIESFAPEDNNDEIDDFLAIEVSSNFEEGYFDSEGDVTFLDSLLSDDDSHNLISEVITNHELLPLSTFHSQGNQTSAIESLPVSPILIEDSELTQEEIDIFLVRMIYSALMIRPTILDSSRVWISQKSQEKLSKQNGASSDRVSEEYKAEAKEAKP
ncbi:hypothetical protein Tco_1402265 [Tanacetum coccineum]